MKWGLLLLVVASALGHSYISSPMSRTNQGQSQTGCRGPTCVGPCDGANPVNRGNIQRGQSLDIRWPRNNHPGGFIRFAWAPVGESMNHAAFDSRVSMITCHERGTVAGGVCAPGSANEPNGGDSKSAGNPADHCAANVVVPDWLNDGQWTLQWAWFGGGFALGDYYSCVDYTVGGGNPLNANRGAIVFQGGDYTNRGTQLCKTFNTDALHRCTIEPCTSGDFLGRVENRKPAGVDVVPTPVASSAAPPAPSTPPRTGNCYANPGAAKNLGGQIASTCGNNNANGRCGDNMCCSRFGYCGATPEYCDNNQGDWRLTPCSGNGGMCYNSNNQQQLHLDGAISRGGQCGTQTQNTRCTDGQCCSKHGFCGVGDTYCVGNQGDWRLVPCTVNNNVAPRDAIYYNSTGEDALLGDSAKVLLGILSAAAIAL